MLRLLIDENFTHQILRGVRSRLPELDFVLVRQIGLAGFEDPALLRWAARNGRIMLTHDINTMVPYANQLILMGESMGGVIVVPQQTPIGRAIKDLELVIVCHSQEEFRDRIEYLPL